MLTSAFNNTRSFVDFVYSILLQNGLNNDNDDIEDDDGDDDNSDDVMLMRKWYL